MPPKKQALSQAFSPELFQALADPARLKVLSEVACAPSCCVGEVASCCPTDMSGVSRHLKVLERAGVLKAEKSGREKRYTLQGKELAVALRALADCLEACSAPAKGRR